MAELINPALGPHEGKNAVVALRRGWRWDNRRTAFVDAENKVVYRYPATAPDTRWGRLTATDRLLVQR
jgi:hypothetical protein